MTETGTIQLRNDERIRRIINKVCEGRLVVFFRLDEVKDSPKIKGVAFTTADNALPTFQCTDFSETGKKILREGARVQVELSMVSNKVMFITQVYKRYDDSIAFTIPRNITILSRRKNMRYLTTPDFPCFANFSKFAIASNDPTSLPTFPCFQGLHARLAVHDVSLGGLAVETGFPLLFKHLEGAHSQTEIVLTFPLEKPIVFNVELRWQKKISLKEQVDGLQLTKRMFRFGFQIHEATEEQAISLKTFIQKLNSAEAI